MRLRGKGINPVAFTECACYVVFGLLLFRLTFTGTYLNYVTPRMKPYLYGLSVLMLIWGVMNGRYLLKPRYKNRLHHCLVLMIPILILAAPPEQPASADMIRSYSGSGLQAAPGGGSSNGSDSSQAPAACDSTGPEQDTETYEEAADETEDWQQPSEEESAPETDLNGLDEEAKTITIADEDFYTWMVEIGTNAEKYEGYTIVIKGFLFLDMEDRKENQFALVRLSMWCCSADMTPIGLLVDYEGSLPFKENDWITVTGKIQAADGYPSIKAEKMEAAQKPAEEYVYPYY